MERETSVESLLQRLRSGDAQAEAELYLLLQGELRRMARGHMARQAADHTLQASALVNEAYLKLAHGGQREWADRAHFQRLASAAMRQVLVDHARRKASAKRQAPGERLELDQLVEDCERRAGDLVELDAALARLAERDPAAVRLIELRFFGGRSMAEAAAVLGVSERQAARWWSAARLQLKDELVGE